MSGVIRFYQPGGPEVLQWEQFEPGEPARDEVRLRHTAIGLNFIDVYERSGMYQVPLPAVPGKEAAGVVEAVGPGVRHVRVGDRVAYVLQSSGAYSQARVMPAERLVKIPEAIEDQRAAALLLKGLTVQVLLRQTYRVRKGDAVLIHAAAGGVGSLAVQWARYLGAVVIGIVGSPAKADMARELGAQHALLQDEDWVARAKEITRGRGVDVVYDSVGQATFLRSLDCLRPRGLMVSYGNASGPVPPFSPLELGRRGSLFLTRPSFYHYIPTRAALVRAAQELFDLTLRDVLKVQIGQTYPLQEAARAHTDLEARRTHGATVLLP